MSDALDLQINIRDNESRKRMDIDAVLSCIPSMGSMTITWTELMYRFSSSKELRHLEKERASTQAKELMVREVNEQRMMKGCTKDKTEDQKEKESNTNNCTSSSNSTGSNSTSGEIKHDHQKLHPVSPDRNWFDRLDTALSETPNGMTPTGKRLMEHHQAVSSVTESQLHLSTLMDTTAVTMAASRSSSSLGAEKKNTVVGNNSGAAVMAGDAGTLTPKGQELQERATMAARAQRLIRGLTRTPPSTAPTPSDLLSRITLFTSSSIENSQSKYNKDMMLPPPPYNPLSSPLASLASLHQDGGTPYRDALNRIRQNTATVISTKDNRATLLHKREAQWKNNSTPEKKHTTLNPQNRSPETPEAVRDLFAFHRRMTQPRKQVDLMELSPMKSPFRDKKRGTNETRQVTRETTETRERSASPERKGNWHLSSSSSPSSSSSSSSSLSSSMLLQSSSLSDNVEGINVEGINMEGGSRSAAMELLSSLRESLQRSETIDFRSSPNKPWMRTPVRDVPKDIISPLVPHVSGMMMSIPEVTEPPHTSHTSHTPQTPHTPHTPTSDSVSKSLDTVTKSALDVLSRLRHTNQTLFEPTAMHNIGSPSFSYLVAASPSVVDNGMNRSTESVVDPPTVVDPSSSVRGLLARATIQVIKIEHPTPISTPTTFAGRVSEIFAEERVELNS